MDDNYKYKPIKFVNDVKRYLDANTQTEAQLIWILLQAMSGAHTPWFNLVTREIKNFEDFEKVFNEKFWNAEIRRNILRDIEFGKHANNKGSRYNYAVRKINLAFDIDEKLNEKELIEKLTRHFDKETKLLVKAQNIVKISKFYLY